MRKDEFVKVVTNELKEKGHKVNQPLVKDMLTAVENAVDGVIANKDEVSVLGVKFATKLQKGKTGIIQLGDRKGQEYTTEDKIVPTVKYLKSKKDSLSVEA